MIKKVQKIYVPEQYNGPNDWRPMQTENGEIVVARSRRKALDIMHEDVSVFWDISKREEKRLFRVSTYVRIG